LDASINASNFARDVAKKFDASLSVLCIVTPTTYIDLGYANVMQTFLQKFARIKKDLILLLPVI